MERFPGSREWWVPAVGEIVEVNEPSQSAEGYGDRLALREMGLEPGKRYEVQEYIQNEEQRALRVREVRIIHVMGKRIVTPIREIPGTPSLSFFQRIDQKEHSE